METEMRLEPLAWKKPQTEQVAVTKCRFEGRSSVLGNWFLSAEISIAAIVQCSNQVQALPSDIIAGFIF